MQHEAGARDTGLALIMENGERRTADRSPDVRVIEHDVGALAAELQMHALQIAGRGLDHLAARCGRAGEGYLVYT